MKVAIVTNDKTLVSKHFGRSQFYKIYNIENAKVIDEEIRDRFSAHEHSSHSHNNNHDEENHQFHGHSQEAQDKHAKMTAQISDCDILIAGGMGRGAYFHFTEAGIKVIMTEIDNTDVVIDKLLNGTLINQFEELTH